VAQSVPKAAVGMRPRLACEIRAEGVIAARAASDRRGSEIVLAWASLPEGAVAPGLKAPNLLDRGAVVEALERALGEVNARNRELTLVIPDPAARVLLLDFDTLPPKRPEALSVVRFRLRKMVPFDVESAAVSYQVMAAKTGALSVLVTVMPGDVLADYESAVRDAGYEPGAVLPSTLAAVAAVDWSGPTLVVNHSPGSVTTAITQEEEMLLHRSVDLPGEAAAREEEMAQAVITTLAWYEDTLSATPGSLYYSGMGGAAAAEQSRWLQYVDRAPRIEDLAPANGASAMTSVPAGVTAAVAGALA